MTSVDSSKVKEGTDWVEVWRFPKRQASSWACSISRNQASPGLGLKLIHICEE